MSLDMADLLCMVRSCSCMDKNHENFYTLKFLSIQYSLCTMYQMNIVQARPIGILE